MFLYLIHMHPYNNNLFLRAESLDALNSIFFSHLVKRPGKVQEDGINISLEQYVFVLKFQLLN